MKGVLKFDEPLAGKTTLKVGGAAEAWFEPRDFLDLGAVFRFCRKELIPYTLFGNGSNLLVLDGGLPGISIHLNAAPFKAVKASGNQIDCGAGIRLMELLQVMRTAGLTGGEFVTGIPGTVGGAIRMNAGAHGGCFADILDTVWVLTPQGNIEEKSREELRFGYRFAPYFRDKVILAASLRLSAGDPESVHSKIKELNRKRAEVTPPNPSAGCIFKNPGGSSAGKLIDETGLKGYQKGEAQVSMSHGNYFVNLGDATASDFLSLIRWVQKRIKEEHRIELETEIKIVGRSAKEQLEELV